MELNGQVAKGKLTLSAAITIGYTAYKLLQAAVVKFGPRVCSWTTHKLTGKATSTLANAEKAAIKGLGREANQLEKGARSETLSTTTKPAVKESIRTEPRNLAEQITLEEAKSGLGEEIMQGKIKDSKYPPELWEKRSHSHKKPDGTNIEVHYWLNKRTREMEGFKFKND